MSESPSPSSPALPVIPGVYSLDRTFGAILAGTYVALV